MVDGEKFSWNLGDFRGVDWSIERIGLMCTDPPFESHMHNARDSSRGRRANGAKISDPLGFAAISEDDRADLCRIAKEYCDGWLLLFSTPEGVAAWRDAIEAAGLKYKLAMPWVKTDNAPKMNGQGPAAACEIIVAAWCGDSYSRWHGGGGPGEFRGPTQSPARRARPAAERHQTEKPLWLMGKLIRLFSDGGDLVADPFGGIASTGVAALRAGRRFVGAELQPGFHATGLERLKGAAMAAPDLFEDAMRSVKPKQQKMEL